MTDNRLKQTVVLQATLAILAVVASWILWSPSATIAVAAGSLVASLDLFLLVWLVKNLIEGDSRRRLFYGAGLIVKFPGLVGVIYLCVQGLELDLLGFLVGISTLVISVTLAGFLLAGNSDTEEP